MSAPWGFALLVGVFFAAMFGSMFVAWLIGRAVGLADRRVDPTPREVEIDAWIDDVLRSGR